jgi:hypothetical protein
MPQIFKLQISANDFCRMCWRARWSSAVETIRYLEHDPDHPKPGAQSRPSETWSAVGTVRYLERSRDHPIPGAQSKAKRVPGRNYVFTRN